jgi:putative aldouronate transport system permease protein
MMKKQIPYTSSTITSNIGSVRKKKSAFTEFRQQLDIQSMLWPGLICLIVFSYIPMYGIIIAFKDYSIYTPGIKGFIAAPWVGFKYFGQFLTNKYFFEALRNTLGMNLLNLAIGFPMPIIFALFLNELTSQRFKKLVQTVSYLPHFISWIIFGGLVMSMLRTDTGVVNNLLMRFGLIDDPIFFMGEPKYFWFIAVFTSIMKELGWSAIIYLAAIAGVDQEMHEAAIIDGAGRFKRMWYITIPSISGTIIILLILRISGMLNSGFDQIYILQNTLNIGVSEVIDTYVYKMGIREVRFSYATAVGLAKSVVAVTLLTTANLVSKKISDKGLY